MRLHVPLLAPTSTIPVGRKHSALSSSSHLPRAEGWHSSAAARRAARQSRTSPATALSTAPPAPSRTCRVVCPVPDVATSFFGLHVRYHEQSWKRSEYEMNWHCSQRTQRDRQLPRLDEGQLPFASSLAHFSPWPLTVLPQWPASQPWLIAAPVPLAAATDMAGAGGAGGARGAGFARASRAQV